MWFRQEFRGVGFVFVLHLLCVAEHSCSVSIVDHPALVFVGQSNLFYAQVLTDPARSNYSDPQTLNPKASLTSRTGSSRISIRLTVLHRAARILMSTIVLCLSIMFRTYLMLKTRSLTFLPHLLLTLRMLGPMISAACYERGLSRYAIALIGGSARKKLCAYVSRLRIAASSSFPFWHSSVNLAALYFSSKTSRYQRDGALPASAPQDYPVRPWSWL